MKFKFIQIFTVLFCLATGALAQPGVSYVTKKTIKAKTKKYFDKARKASKASDNEAALKYLGKALKSEPQFIDAHLLTGMIHYDMDAYLKAETAFEAAIELDPMYIRKVLYTLGITEWKLGKFEEAAEHFAAYLKVEKKNEVLLKKAKRYQENALFAAQAIKNPVPFKPKSLGPNINTTNAEYLPSFTADGELLIYTSRVRGQEDFYMSSNIDGVWQKGKPMQEINTPNNEGAQSISADGRFMVFTACNRKDGYGSCDLYFSEVRDGRWTPPANIGSPINSKGWESQPSISANGQAIYFTSSRSGGVGGKDIWVSHRKSSGKWSAPENLGSAVNTKMDDQSPFIHADNQTLYFMSKGHPGMGEYDLFLAKRGEDQQWSKPQNLGYPINTKSSEGALVVSRDGKTAYFASDRKLDVVEDSSFDNGKSGAETDIYSFVLHEAARPNPVTYVKAVVFDAITKKKLRAQVDFVELASEQNYASSTTDLSGEFLVCLPLGKDYALNVSKEKYLFHSENFALEKASDTDAVFLLEIYLQPIPTVASSSATPAEKKLLTEVKPIILKNVFFETAKADLRPVSITELTRLKKLLEENPDLKIRINGHTDNVGSDVDNLSLSENRAKAVYTYLVQEGIAADRLSYKGYGETIPIDTNDTEEGRQRNRRTEFVIVR